MWSGFTMMVWEPRRCSMEWVLSFQAVSEDWWMANLLKNEDVRTHQSTPLFLDLVELEEMHVWTGVEVHDGFMMCSEVQPRIFVSPFFHLKKSDKKRQFHILLWKSFPSASDHHSYFLGVLQIPSSTGNCHSALLIFPHFHSQRCRPDRTWPKVGACEHLRVHGDWKLVPLEHLDHVVGFWFGKFWHLWWSS